MQMERIRPNGIIKTLYNLRFSVITLHNHEHRSKSDVWGGGAANRAATLVSIPHPPSRQIHDTLVPLTH